MQDLIPQLLPILSFLSIVLIPLIILILTDLRKLIQTIEQAQNDDGQIDFEELQEILMQVGFLVKRVFRLFGNKT